MSKNIGHRIIWLSHIIDENTLMYRGEGKVIIQENKAIKKGDSCNTKIIKLPNHTGTHVDVQTHFIENGFSVSDYGPEEWIFLSPVIIDVEAEDYKLITPQLIHDIEEDINIDLVLLRTGFEKKRNDKTYCERNPGIKEETIDLLLKKFPSMRGFGCDLISISNHHFREEGRKCHKKLLSLNILIFEDMSLINVKDTKSLVKVVALPLRVKKMDGSPVCIIGYDKRD